MALIVESLDKARHDRAAFNCGEAALDDFFRTKAAKHQRQRISRTFVLIDTGQPRRALGYHSLANSQIAREHLNAKEAKALPRHPIPAIMLARLAVDRGCQGRHYGRWLLMDAIKRCALVGQQTGVYALLVEARSRNVKGFYERFGFNSIDGHSTALYLPLATGLLALKSVQR